MNKTTKILFLLAGCIFPIFIGSLHTFAHLKDLTTPEIEEFLQREFLVMGQAQIFWETFGVVSFMMGASFIVIGLINISVLLSSKKSDTLPILPIIAMMLYQLSVTYVGVEYNQVVQHYGGIFGLIVLSTCLILTLKLNTNK